MTSRYGILPDQFPEPRLKIWLRSRLAAAQMIELLVRLHHIAPVDAYLLCSVCGDLAISELVNRPTHVVSLYFPRFIFG